MCAYHASVLVLTGVRLTWSRAHARRHCHVSFRASRSRRRRGAAAISKWRYATLAAAAAHALLPCVYHEGRASRGRPTGGPRRPEGSHACMHACMQTGWRSRPRHPSAGPGVKTGAPRVRVPPDAAGPRVNAHQGSPAINDSFDGVQKRSRAGIDNLYKALSRGLTLIITLTNFLPTSKCGGSRRWSRVAELWVGPGREGVGRSGGRCAARGGHGTLQREACRARLGAERARPCRNSSKITPLVVCRLATLLSRRGPAPGALTNCSAGIDTSLSSVRGIGVDAPRPRGRRALPHHASMVCLRFSSPLARPAAGMAWLGDALLSSRIHRLPATAAHTPSSPGTVVQLSTGRRTGCRAWRAA